jgi:hypothetical protein
VSGHKAALVFVSNVHENSAYRVVVCSCEVYQDSRSLIKLN